MMGSVAKIKFKSTLKTKIKIPLLSLGVLILINFYLLDYVMHQQPFRGKYWEFLLTWLMIVWKCLWVISHLMGVVFINPWKIDWLLHSQLPLSHHWKIPYDDDRGYCSTKLPFFCMYSSESKKYRGNLKSSHS